MLETLREAAPAPAPAPVLPMLDTLRDLPPPAPQATAPAELALETLRDVSPMAPARLSTSKPVVSAPQLLCLLGA